MPFTPIAPAPNRQASTGLIALAPAGLDEGVRPGAWEQGFSFDPEICDPGLLYAMACQIDTEKATEANPDLVEYLPVMVVGFDACTTLDPGRDGEGRARRHLANVQSHQLERAFWTGEATDDPTANGGDRPHLADSTAEVLNSGTATDAAVGLSLLDQALTSCLHGVQGMIHATPYTLAEWHHRSSVEFVNGRYLTPNGHLVVAGSGYTGGAPRASGGAALPAAPDLTAPADQWAYATPTVTVLLGAVETFGDVDRAVNTRTWRAERPAAAFHGCCKFAVQLLFTGLN